MTTRSGASIPNPALQPLGVLVGEWRTTGAHPMVPDTTFHGQTSFAWHEGGAFLIMRSQIDESEIPNGVAIIGSDDAAGTFFMIYFDEREVSRKYDVTLIERGFVWSRDEAGFAQRQTLEASDDGSRLTGSGEMSRDGGDWEGDLSLAYERVG
ncbi:hypothetical protein BH11ACT3_BH11ACT3_20660 [soil metagenome]